MFKGYLYPFLQWQGVALHLFQRPKINPGRAVLARNASSDKCHIMLPNMRRAVFAGLIIFACLAFPAA